MSSSHLLVYSPTHSLFEEVEQALPAGLKSSVVLHGAQDLTHAVDFARDLSPFATIIDYPGEFEAFRAAIQEVLSVAPQTIVAGAFHPNHLELTTPDELFVSGVRAGAQDFLRRPVSASDLRQLLDRSRRADFTPRGTSGTTVSFLSNKGGVGKSTLAVNVATRLALQHPGEVLLIDASLQMGVCAPMLNLHPETTLLDAIRERQRLDSTLIRQLATPHTCGLDLLAAPPDAIAATEIDEQLMTRVLNLARRTYRYVVIDTFPMFDRIVMSILDATDLAFIVLDNVVPTVLSIRQLLELLDELGHPHQQQRIAVNRMTSVAGHPTRLDMEATIDRPIDYVFPYHKRALTSANLGQPFALSRSWWSPLEKNLRAIVRDIEQHRRDPIGENGAVEAAGERNGRPKPGGKQDD